VRKSFVLREIGKKRAKKAKNWPQRKKMKMHKNNKSKTGLEIFEEISHPAVVAKIRGWANHPERSKILHTLESQKKQEPFSDIYAEAMIARYLISKGCELKVEVPTKNGKSADFKVSKGGNAFFVHVKRSNFDRDFQHALDAKSDSPVKDGADNSRYLRKLKSAYKQFMPNEINVILITSAWRDSSSIGFLKDDLDDFWSNGKHSDSSIVGYFTFEPTGESIDFELIFREGSDKTLNVAELFDCN